MATLTFTMNYRAIVDGKTATASCPVTLTYTTSSNDTTFTMTTSSVAVGAISTTGDNRARGRAATGIMSALSTTGAICNFNNAQVFQKTGLEPSKTYTTSYSKAINRTTAAQSIPLQLRGTYGSKVANLTVPARSSWDVTYNANSGSGAPSSQKKYYGYNLTLNSGRPTKTDHTFKGWATTTARAGSGTVDWNPSAVYTSNAALALYATWERNYAKPIITDLRVERCQQNGKLDDDGHYAKVTFNWTVLRTSDKQYYGGSSAPYASNRIATDGCVVKVGDVEVKSTSADASGTYSEVIGTGGFDSDTAYPVTISITDSQTVKSDKTTTVTGQLATANFPIDVNADATAIAFLSTAPEDDAGVFSPDMTAEEIQAFVDNLESGGGNGTADRVVEQGISGIWTYRKWASGVAECWGTYSHTAAHYVGPYASLLYGYNCLNLGFPSGLFESGSRPYAVYGVKIGSAFSMAAANLSVTATGMNLYALSTASGSQSIMWDIHVKGRWK